MIEQQVFGQAIVYIAIQRYTTVFKDTFSRTTTAPPFNVGYADSGQLWHWSDVDTGFSESTSLIYVDGSVVVMPSGRTYDSMYIGDPKPTLEVGEVWIDFWVPAAGDNSQDAYWLDKNWGIGWGQQSDTTFWIRSDIYVYPTYTARSAWYTLHIKVDRYEPSGNYVKAKIWKVGDAEPETWLNVSSTSTWPVGEWWSLGAIEYDQAPHFTWDYTSNNETSKADNFIVRTVGPFLYNQGNASAQVHIILLPHNDTPVFGQASTFIFQSGIFYYNWIIDNDNPAAYYKLENLDTQPTSGGFITDALGSYNLTFYNNRSPSSSKVLGVEGYGGQVFANYGFRSGTIPITSGSHGWALEWWIKPNSPNPDNNTQIWDTNGYFYFGLCQPDSRSYTDRSQAPWNYWSPSTGTKAVLSLAYRLGGTWYNTWVGSSSLSASDWHHVVATLSDDQTILSLYADGSLVDSVTLSPPPDLNTWPGTGTGMYFSEGDYSTDTTAYDEFVIYNHALSNFSVLNHYTIGTTGSPLTIYFGQACTLTVYRGDLGEYIWPRTANSLADIRNFDNSKYSQAQAFIRKSAGYGQAKARVAISPSDIYAYLVAQDGAASYWPMDSIAIADTDLIGNVNLTKGSYFSSGYNYPGINPPYNAAIGLYYYSGYLRVPYRTRFQGSQWTLEGWVHFSTYSARVPVFAFSNPITIGQSGTTLNSSGTYITVTQGSTVYNTGIVVNPSASIWYYLVVTYDNGTYTLYINGIQALQWFDASIASSYLYMNSSPSYGNPSSATYTFYDGVAAYDLVLTPTQISRHYMIGGYPQQRYSQVLASINMAQQAAQASWYIYDLAPGAMNIFQQFSQTAVGILVTTKRYAQARVRIISSDISRSAQTQAALNPGYAPTPNMGLYVNQDNTSSWVQTAPGWPNFPSQTIHANSQWWITGSFIVDVSGTWQFQMLSDYHSILYIDGVSTIDVAYNQGTIAANKIFNVGEQHTITLWWQGDGAPNALIAQYKRPADTYWNYLTSNNPPWTPLYLAQKIYSQAQAQIYAFNFPQWAQTLAYIGHFQYGQAKADIKQTYVQASQTQVCIGHMQTSQAITQIGYNVLGYRKAVLTDHPILYYPMDESSYGDGLLHSIVGRRNAAWNSSGETFGVTGNPSNAGTAISFNGHLAYSDGIISGGQSKTVALTVPGTYDSNNGGGNKISPDWWGIAGDIVTVHITTPPTSSDIGITQAGGENQWWSVGGYQTTNGLSGTAGTNVSWTLTTTGYHFVYLWGYNSGYTGSGTVTYIENLQESPIPLATGSAITVETWINWNGTGDFRMIFGFNLYDFYVNAGHIGFNAANGQWETAGAVITAGTWYHVAAVMYNAQAFNIANKIYVNGALQTLAGGNQTGSFTPYFNIGGWSANGNYRWTGSVDEFAIFDHELTGGQILTHFQARTNLPPAQAQTYISPAFNQPQFAQANVWIGHQQFAQTQAKINSFNFPQLGQTQALVASQYAFLVSGNPYSAWFDSFATSWEAYDTGWPNYPYPANYYNFSAVARFTADTSGTWNFRVTVDDHAFLVISGTTVLNSSITGWGSYNTGSISLVSGAEYNISFGLTNSDLNNEYLVIQYQRPGDSTWYYLTDGHAPWALKTRGRACSQASAFILRPPYRQVYGQAQVYLQPRVYGQAQAQIGHQSYAQAQARVRAFGIKGYAQALVFIGHFQSGQAQAKLNAFGVKKYSQTQAWLWHPAGYGNAKTWIKAIYSAFGQAMCWYLPATGKGQAQASIKQTYPLMSIDTNYALTTMGAIATDSMGQLTPINTIDGQDYGPVWEIFGPQAHFENDTWVQDDEWLQIDFGPNRTVNYYRIVPVRYDASVSLQYFNDGYGWVELIHGITFNVGIFDPIDMSKAIAGEIPPITKHRWRLLVDNLGTNNGVSVATFELGFATVKSGTFAQAQASFGHFAIGQVRAYLWPAFGLTTFGQAKASIIRTYQTYTQANAWVIPPTVTGLALADVLRTFSAYSQVNTWVIPPTVIANAQAKVIAYDVSRVGQAKTRVLQTYAKTGYAKVKITKTQGIGQALVTIKDRIHGKSYGQAKVYIGHYQFASTLAYIIKNWEFAQAKALIRRVDIQRYSQARVVIYPWPSSQVQADIKQTYRAIGGAIALLNTGLETAYVQADIMHTYYSRGDSQADIKQVYSPYSQAQVVIHERHYQHAQARATISKQRFATGQAMVWVGYHKFSQAYARIIAFNVPKFGLAAGYILVGQAIPPDIGPTSDYQTYLVRFNGHDLPGYVQSESYSNDIGLNSYPTSYVDGSVIEDTGLKNIVIVIEMLVWEPTYEACKDKVRLAATIMRSARGFAPLYIQHKDKYYLAIANSLTVSKQVPESSTVLKYTLTFEARPVKINS